MRPLIGIPVTPVIPDDRPPRFVINQAYPRAIEWAGGVPLLIPSFGNSAALRSTFDAVDGVLLAGGADLQPTTYGADRHPLTDEGSATLDETELEVARWALAEDKPIFGICRGLQCINVALGGTLFQDIAVEVPGALSHRFEPRTSTAHPIDVTSDSRLADLIGATQVSVNSLHHQAVRDLAPGLMAVACAPDGVVEGVEQPDHRFAVAVQFHPEELVPGHTASERLFQRFVAAATR